MTKEEFMFEHDLHSVAYLLEKHATFNGMGSSDKEEKLTETSAKSFFSI